MTPDETYMMRALALARAGELHASPNPMVGAVIVAPDGRIIGEGFHRRCGDGHAEVNAIASVEDADKGLLTESTMYVSLEPCSHFGKTPPCADLIVKTGLKRVVIAMKDPFEKVAGKGIKRLIDNGIDVTVGVLEQEAKELNRKFITAHTLRRPFVTLKWAQSADGFLDGRDSPLDPPALISTAATKALVHRERALHDAILVGSRTFLADKPSLATRRYAGRSPRRYVADRSRRLQLPEGWTRLDQDSVAAMLSTLYERDGVTSLLVEGGRKLLQAFIDEGLYDQIRVETNPSLFLADKPLKTPAPKIH